MSRAAESPDLNAVTLGQFVRLIRQEVLMRRFVMVSTLFVFIVLWNRSLIAADSGDSRWRMSILASDISDRHDSNSNLQAGLGVALAYSVAPGWNLEVAAARQSYQSPFTSFEIQSGPSGIGFLVPVTRDERFTVFPVDLVMHRDFRSDRPVSPYLSAGLRYVDAPNDPNDGSGGPPVNGFVPVRTGFGFGNRTSAQAGIGLRWRLTPGAALRLELTRVLRNQGVAFDPLNRATLGITWRL